MLRVVTVPARLAATSTRPRRSISSGPVLAVAVVAVVAVDLAATLLVGRLERTPALVATFFSGLAALVAAGVVTQRLPGQQSNGRLMLAMAGASSAVDLLGVRPDIGPSAFLARIASWYSIALFGLLLLRWPGSRLTGRPGRATVASAAVALPLLTLAWELRWDPRWFGAVAAGWWWPAVAPDRDLAFQLYLAGELAFVALIAVFVTLVVVRIVRHPRDAAVVPIGVAAALLALATLVGVAQGLGLAVPADPDLVENLAVLTVPVAVLIGVATGAGTAALAPDDAASSAERPRQEEPTRPVAIHLALQAVRVAFIAALLLIAVVFGARSVAAGVAGSPAPTPQPLPAPVAPGTQG